MNHETYLPNSQKSDEEVAREAGSEHLGDNEDVGCQRRLQHDGHVRGVEELDGVGTTLSAEPVALDRNFNPESLEVDNSSENDDGCNEVHDIGEAVAPESFPERTALVVPGEKQMEQRDNGTLEFWATTSVDRGGGEGFPDDGFTDVGGDEKGDTRAKAIAFLQELVEEDNNECGDDKLDDEKKTDARAQVAWLTV